jgi:hypothetical protein
LVERLLALRAVVPRLRLEAATVAADGDLVIVQVRVRGAAPMTFLGLRLADDRAAWAAVDVLRIEHGRIVERGGPAADPGLPPPALRVALKAGPPAHRTLAIARLPLAPGARHVAPAVAGQRFVLAEAGTLVIEPLGRTGRQAGPPVALAAGIHLAVPPGSGVTVRNVGRRRPRSSTWRSSRRRGTGLPPRRPRRRRASSAKSWPTAW